MKRPGARLVLAAAIALSTTGVDVPLLLAGEPEPSAEDAALLQEMAASIRTQQQELERQWSALALATDPDVKRRLQAQVETLQADIRELTRLKQALLAPLPSGADSAAVQAADALERHLDRQQQREELILNDRAAGESKSR